MSLISEIKVVGGRDESEEGWCEESQKVGTCSLSRAWFGGGCAPLRSWFRGLFLVIFQCLVCCGRGIDDLGDGLLSLYDDRDQKEMQII